MGRNPKPASRNQVKLSAVADSLLAEFRIIQTKVNVANAWIAYLVPTRALVNQVTVRLRRDLGPLGIKVEQATPAYELDSLEEELFAAPGSFDVLVTTPEKLDLLIRSGAADQGDRPLGLVVLDEAHNLGDGERGLRSELVLATINRESPDTHFLTSDSIYTKRGRAGYLAG